LKKILIFLIPLFLFAVDNQKLIDCYEIFAQKKAELEAQAERLIEKQEALEALKNTYMALIKKKEEKLKQKELEVNMTLKKIEEEKKQIQKLLEEYKKLLDEIKNAKLDKVTQSYAKMRPKNAAQILENMPENDALAILQKLPPKIIAKIFAKMNPQKAAALSEKLLKLKETNESATPANANGG